MAALSDERFDSLLASCDAGTDVGVLHSGERLADWEITGLIGKGGSAEVYRAVRFGGVAAIKLFAAESETARRRFDAEIALLEEAPLRVMPRLLSKGEYQGHPYVILEYLWPIELPETERAVAGLVLEVCAAVSALHRAGLVHRDLKPSNLMRRSTGELVLIDLGLAKPFAQSRFATEGLSIVDGKAVGAGTPGYAAPEQFQGGEVTPQTDIHAIGMLAYRCLVRVSATGLVPPEWQRILQRAMCSVPEQRYWTVEEFAATVRHRKGRKRFAFYLIALASVGTALAVGLLSRQKGVDATSSSRQNKDVSHLTRRDGDVASTALQQPQETLVFEDFVTNKIERVELWRQLETNEIGMVLVKRRAFSNVTHKVSVKLFDLKGETRVLSQPLVLEANRHYLLKGPGVLDAELVSAGSNTVIELNGCTLIQRSEDSPVGPNAITYQLENKSYLNFVNLNRPECREYREFPDCKWPFDSRGNEIRFRGPLDREGRLWRRQEEHRSAFDDDFFKRARQSTPR